MIVICGGEGEKEKAVLENQKRNKAFFFLSCFLFRILISQI